jgi:hypothetical protein
VGDNRNRGNSGRSYSARVASVVEGDRLGLAVRLDVFSAQAAPLKGCSDRLDPDAAERLGHQLVAAAVEARVITRLAAEQAEAERALAEAPTTLRPV